MTADLLAPKRPPRRRHPKMLPEGAKDELRGVMNTARDEMVL
ncbi:MULTISPECIES: hypothetical protein [Streptomyces]|nr:MULTISPECIES: hypothetical protein [Streptomyces]MCZ4103262.1 hypothetical protein [Streptomyces sp. H39-C1]